MGRRFPGVPRLYQPKPRSEAERLYNSTALIMIKDTFPAIFDGPQDPSKTKTNADPKSKKPSTHCCSSASSPKLVPKLPEAACETFAHLTRINTWTAS